MLVFPPDWIHQFGVNLVTAVAPGLGARFRYREQVPGRLRFSAVVASALADDPDFEVHRAGAMLRTVTCEGEYGAWIAIAGLRHGGAAMRYVGATFVDDMTTMLDAVATIPAAFSRIETWSQELMASQRFDLATRPRRFFYTPPPGWQSIPAGLSTNWYPPDFPANLTTITVPPALTLAAGPTRDGMIARTLESAADAVGLGLTLEQHRRDEVITATGMRGLAVSVVGRRAGNPDAIHREAAYFVSGDRAYRAQLETTSTRTLPALRSVFQALVQSIQPLPAAHELRAGHAFTPATDALAHWAT